MTARSTPHKTYARAPIEQVVCEFRFPERPQSIRIRDRIHDELRALYPTQSKGPGDDVVISTSDRHANVRFTERELRIGESHAYSGWIGFKDRIHQALRVFLEIAEPPSVSQIDLQYRNAILIPERTPLIADYFTLGATIPHGLPTRFISLVTAIRSAYDDDPRSVLSLGLSVTPVEHAGNHGMEASVEVMTSKVQLNEPADPDALLHMLEELHAKAVDAFENVITARTRRLFD